MRTWMLSLLMVGGIYTAACSNTNGNAGASLDATNYCVNDIDPNACTCLWNKCLTGFQNYSAVCEDYFTYINQYQCGQLDAQFTASDWMTCAASYLNGQNPSTNISC